MIVVDFFCLQRIPIADTLGTSLAF